MAVVDGPSDVVVPSDEEQARPWVRYEYAVIRVVPRVDRGEALNAGVVVFCRARRFLGARVGMGEARERAVQAIAPDLDLDQLRERLDIIPKISAGGSGSGPIGQLSIAERFHWLVAPQSTVVQPGPVHTGICTDPARALHDLYEDMLGPTATDSSEATGPSSIKQGVIRSGW